MLVPSGIYNTLFHVSMSEFACHIFSFIIDKFDLPFATCAGIGDGHCLVFMLFEDVFFAFVVVVESGRSKDEQR